MTSILTVDALVDTSSYTNRASTFPRNECTLCFRLAFSCLAYTSYLRYLPCNSLRMMKVFSLPQLLYYVDACASCTQQAELSCMHTCLFDGGGDHDPLHATVEVRLQLLLGQEFPLKITTRRGETHRKRDIQRERRSEGVVEGGGLLIRLLALSHSTIGVTLPNPFETEHLLLCFRRETPTFRRSSHS